MQEQHTTRTRRALPYVLGVSLAVNLLVAGLFAGAAYRHADMMGPGGRHVPGVRDYATPYVQSMPEDGRRAIGKALRSGPQSKALSREARRALYTEMLVALRSEPFDPARAGQVLAAQKTAVEAVQEAAQAAWLAEVTRMDGTARRAYADALEQELQRGPKRRDDKRKN